MGDGGRGKTGSGMGSLNGGEGIAVVVGGVQVMALQPQWPVRGSKSAGVSDAIVCCGGDGWVYCRLNYVVEGRLSGVTRVG